MTERAPRPGQKRHDSGEHRINIELRALKEDLAQLEKPQLAKTKLSTLDLYKLRAKQDFAIALHATGMSQREAARLLHVDESAVRGWLDERDLRRHPPQWATYALGRAAKIVAARRLVEGIDSEPPDSTGTDG